MDVRTFPGRNHDDCGRARCPTQLGCCLSGQARYLDTWTLAGKNKHIVFGQGCRTPGRTRSGGDRIEHLRGRSLAVIFSIEQRRFSRCVASMACVLDHDPSRQRIFCLHHPCPSRAGGQSVAAAVFPPFTGIFAGRHHEPFGKRIFSRAIARIARGAHFATKSPAARVSSLLLVPGHL